MVFCIFSGLNGRLAVMVVSSVKRPFSSVCSFDDMGEISLCTKVLLGRKMPESRGIVWLRSRDFMFSLALIFVMDIFLELGSRKIRGFPSSKLGESTVAFG